MKHLFFLFMLSIFSCAPIPMNTTTLPTDKAKSVYQSKQADVIMLNHNGETFRVITAGLASYTADEIEGKRTASGEIYHMRQLVAAHPSLPFNTIVRVKNLANNKSVDVRINDRGPFVSGRIIDLSFESAKRLDFIRQGTTSVTLEIVKLPE